MTTSPVSGLVDSAPAGSDESLLAECPEDDLGIGCILRRTDARVRNQLAGNGLLRIVWHGLLMFDLAGPNSARFVDIENVGRTTREFSARLSRIELINRDVDGGRETNLTLAANWYVTPHARIGANLLTVLQLDGGPFDGDAHGDYAFVVRLQYDLF